MKLHVFQSIRSHKKTTALALSVLMTSVIVGGCYANTVEGQSVIEGIIQQIPQAAASAPSAEAKITLAASSSEEANVTIRKGTATPVKAIVTASVTAEDTTQATEAVTQAATEAMTQATAVATIQATAAATQEATEATTQETVKPAATVPVKAPASPAATTAAPVKAATATTAAPAATTAAPAATTAAPAATTAAPAVVEVVKTADTSGSYNSDMAYAVLDLVNQQRAAAGLAGLSWNGTLAESANIRASEIVIKWAHTRPDGSEWWTAGAQMQMGENLAYGQSSASQVVAEWMASPGHAANVLGSYTVMGVSCYYTNGTYYWAQHFA